MFSYFQLNIGLSRSINQNTSKTYRLLLVSFNCFRIFILLHRQLNLEHNASWLPISHRQLAFVLADDLLGDSEAEAIAAGFFGTGAVFAIEAFEDVLLVFVTDGRAVVFDFD